MPKVIAGASSLLLILSLLLIPDATINFINHASSFVMKTSGQSVQVVMLVSFLVGLLFCVRPAASESVGHSDEVEFGYLSWQALIICTLLAGGGLFWSAAEPVYHHMSAPPLFQDGDKISNALAQSHFHWGFLAWSVLGTLGVVALHFASKDGLPLQPRSLLYPLVSKPKVLGPVGDLVDGVSFLAVIAGTVGPIGFLGIQLAYLVNDIYGLPAGVGVQVGLILVLSAIYTLSAVSGITKGMKWLSQLNVLLSIGLGLAVLACFSYQEILGNHLAAQSQMLKYFVALSLRNQGDAWMLSWTWFYWAWFIGYAPMMSIIVTRVSRGRRLRQIILSVSLVCPLVTNLWFSIIGGSLFTFPNFETEILQSLKADGLPAALAGLVSNLPFAEVQGLLFCVLIFTFLATTGDSVSFSLSVASTNNEEPPRGERVFWSVSMGCLAIALLVFGGSKAISSFQSVIIITAIPVSVIMCFPLVTVLGRLLGQKK